MEWWLVILAWYALMSAITFCVYGWDKRRAVRGSRRVPEKTLQLLALVGGWPGAHAARALFRHKTQKRWFTVVLWMITLLHVMAWLAYLLWPAVVKN